MGGGEGGVCFCEMRAAKCLATLAFHYEKITSRDNGELVCKSITEHDTSLCKREVVHSLRNVFFFNPDRARLYAKKKCAFARINGELVISHNLNFSRCAFFSLILY